MKELSSKYNKWLLEQKQSHNPWVNRENTIIGGVKLLMDFRDSLDFDYRMENEKNFEEALKNIIKNDIRTT